MSLSSGTRLGPYEVLAPLGAGGMGEVYRARDSRLGREVAVKVLRQHLSSSAEVRSRFEREARTVSSLNHPHICVLHDVGREGETDYLVMELVEGETLAHRLTRGPLPSAEVVRLGVQIADALDRAHRAGVVHRDLKPGNVMLTRSGAKLMDFGLARATGLQPGPAGSAMTQSPTVAQPLTAEGTLLGTFQYMAPEQLEGGDADARSDIWAMGCLLYEMATGLKAFEGRSQASLISAIMSSEPRPISQLAPMSPASLDRLVRACLAKDPDERLQTAHDLKLQLQWLGEPDSTPAAARPALRRRGLGRAVAWSFGAAALVLTGALTLPRLAPRRPEAGAMRLAILPPENVKFDEDELQVAVAPDGASVAFVATDSSGISQLWVRELAASEPRRLPGTEQAFLPFWSPDSRAIGFFTPGKLKKVDLAGKNVQTLGNAPDGRGAAWSPRGVIVFAPNSQGGLARVAQDGGSVQAAVSPDSARHEVSLRFPCFLPDGRRFLYIALSGVDSIPVRLGSLDDSRTSWVMNGEGAAVYAAPGYLLYSRGEDLIVRPFDARRGRPHGEPTVLSMAPGATSYGGAPAASVSANGTIAQRYRSRLSTGLAWLDREGRKLGRVPTAPAQYVEYSLSPDDRRVAIRRRSAETGGDIWTIDLERGLASPLTADVPLCESPIWSPDGRFIAFSGFIGPTRTILSRRANGAGVAETLLVGNNGFINPQEWSQSGYLLYRTLETATGEDLMAIRLDGERRPFPILQSRYHEGSAALSPDGRWLAYRSDESGRTELYVQSFPEPEIKHRVSLEGSGPSFRASVGRAHWRADGRELVYVSGDGVTVMSATVETTPTLRIATPRPLFRLPPAAADMVPTSDLRRFLLLEQQQTRESETIQLIVNWPAELTARK